jgi:hypothetical protein
MDVRQGEARKSTGGGALTSAKPTRLIQRKSSASQPLPGKRPFEDDFRLLNEQKNLPLPILYDEVVSIGEDDPEIPPAERLSVDTEPACIVAQSIRGLVVFVVSEFSVAPSGTNANTTDRNHHG